MASHRIPGLIGGACLRESAVAAAAFRIRSSLPGRSQPGSWHAELITSEALVLDRKCVPGLEHRTSVCCPAWWSFEDNDYDGLEVLGYVR
jgi:hypothetical protein